MIILEDARPVARKEHRCDECRRVIQPGEQYHRQRNIGEDGPYVWKCCRQCRSLLQDLWANDYRGDDDRHFPLLPDVDWPDVALLGPVWLHRIVLWKRQWRRRGELASYPVSPQAVTA